jgi:hypothetical protein
LVGFRLGEQAAGLALRSPGAQWALAGSGRLASGALGAGDQRLFSATVR